MNPNECLVICLTMLALAAFGFAAFVLWRMPRQDLAAAQSIAAACRENYMRGRDDERRERTADDAPVLQTQQMVEYEPRIDPDEVVDVMGARE